MKVSILVIAYCSFIMELAAHNSNTKDFSTTRTLSRVKRQISGLPGDAIKMCIHNLGHVDFYGSAQGGYSVNHGSDMAVKIPQINGQVIKCDIYSTPLHHDQFNVLFSIKDISKKTELNTKLMSVNKEISTLKEINKNDKSKLEQAVKAVTECDITLINCYKEIREITSVVNQAEDLINKMNVFAEPGTECKNICDFCSKGKDLDECCKNSNKLQKEFDEILKYNIELHDENEKIKPSISSLCNEIENNNDLQKVDLIRTRFLTELENKIKIYEKNIFDTNKRIDIANSMQNDYLYFDHLERQINILSEIIKEKETAIKLNNYNPGDFTECRDMSLNEMVEEIQFDIRNKTKLCHYETLDELLMEIYVLHDRNERYALEKDITTNIYNKFKDLTLGDFFNKIISELEDDNFKLNLYTLIST